MLFLTRKINEAIMIGEDIEIKISMLNNKQALIGIEAPKELIIHRKEVYERRLNLMNNIRKGIF